MDPHSGGEVLVGGVLRAGQVFHESCGYRWVLVGVSNPRRLVHAVELYAPRGTPISALQVVWSDRNGRFPGSPDWQGRRGEQELFGRLPRPAGGGQACRGRPRRSPARRR